MSYPFDSEEMSDEELADFEQAFQEQPSMEELDKMFAWWEVQRK